MKSKIKQITLLDGKQLFYPSEEEMKKVDEQIASVIIEETMSKEEFEKQFILFEPLTICKFVDEEIRFTPIDPKDFYSQNGDG